MHHGQHLDRYLILEHVGSGGMSDVYRAYDSKLKREVALKLLRRADEFDDGAARLMREAQAMAQLSHPNVLQIFDIGDDTDIPFLAMEFVEGQTLSQWSRARDRGLEACLDVYVRAGRGLAAAHARGLVHRDFKPGNVMIGDDGRVRVMDFGLVRRSGEHPRPPTLDGSVDDALASELTEHGSVLGTPRYMSPEQHHGEPSDAKTDQYAFCIALYTALYRQYPFRQPALAQMVRAKDRGDVKFPTKPRLQVPEHIRSAIARGLHPTPAERWPNMTSLLEALAPKPRRGLQVAALAGILTAVGVAGAYAAGGALEQPCDPGGLLDNVWTPARADGLREVVTDAHTHTAPVDAATYLLDGWAQTWSDEFEDACKLGMAKPKDLEPRLACLERHRVRARVAIDRLLDPTTKSDAARALSLVESLPLPTDCIRLDGRDTLESNVRAEVESIDTELAELRADTLLQADAPILDRAKTLQRRAESLAHTPLDLRAADVAANAHLMLGRPREAARIWEDAYFQAVVERRASQAASLAVELIGVHGDDLDDPAEGLSWARHADAWIAQDDALTGELLLQRARVRFNQGDYPAAIVDADAARDTILSVRGQHNTQLELAVRIRANALMFSGHTEAALEAYETCIDLASETYGASHPEVAIILVNYGGAKSVTGDLSGALEILHQARAMYREANPNHPGLIETNTNLGAIEAQRGNTSASIAHFERSIQLVEANGSDPYALVDPMSNLAASYIVLERFEDALTLLERLEREGPTTFEIPAHAARIHRLRGSVLQGLERPAEAIESWAAALQILEGLDSPGPDLLARTRLELGRSYAAAGQAERARHQYALALELAEHNARHISSDTLEELRRLD